MHVVDTECIASSLFREELVCPSVMNFGVNDHHLAVRNLWRWPQVNKTTLSRSHLLLGYKSKVLCINHLVQGYTTGCVK